MKVKKIIDSVVKPANLEAKTAVVKELLDYTGAYGRIPYKLRHQTQILFGPDSDLLDLISNYNRVVAPSGGEEDLAYAVLSGDPFDETDETNMMGDGVDIENAAIEIHMWAAQHGVRTDNIPQWDEDHEPEDIENDYKMYTHNKVKPL